jgi:transposase
MVDINDDPGRVRGRMEIRTGIIRRRRWTDEEKGRLVAEAVAPGAVIAEVARRPDLTPQHLSNWIRAAKEGHFALPANEAPALCRWLWKRKPQRRRHPANAPAPLLS